MLPISHLPAPPAPEFITAKSSLWIAEPGPQNVRIPAHASILDIYLGRVPGRYDFHELTDDGWQQKDSSTSLPRSFCFLPPGRQREIWTLRAGRAVRVAFSDEVLRAYGGEKSALANRMMHVTDPALLGVASIFSEGVAATGKPLQESADGFVKVFVARLVQLAGGSSQPSSAAEVRPVQKALAFVEEHLGEPLRLAEVAQRSGVSPYHFARLFRSSLGVSLHYYILSRRVALAERLIFETDAGLADVACQAGLSSQSHMTKVFRRLTGRTPGEHRRGRYN